MPAARTKKSSATLADLLGKVGQIKTTQLVYLLLLVATFLLGYLFARVQLLEKAGVAPSVPTAANPQAGGPSTAPVKADVKNGHLPVQGNANAKITVVEFSDFQCPFCEQFFTNTLPKIKKDYIDTGKVKLYYRQFPLDFHPAAMPGALASECANEQGKFWEFHDKVFGNQSKIGAQGMTADQINQQYKAWAQELGLNTTQFNSCLDSEKYKAQVTADQNDGKAAGTNGTPTFYINGTQLVGAQPYDAFKAALDAVK